MNIERLVGRLTDKFDKVDEIVEQLKEHNRIMDSIDRAFNRFVLIVIFGVVFSISYKVLNDIIDAIRTASGSG